jgi:hypothetical protein
MSDPYTLYYLHQAKGRYGGEYHGAAQKGDCLGSFLGGLFRQIFPLARSRAQAFGTEALSTSVGLLKGALNGRTLKESLYDRDSQAGKYLTNKAAKSMESMIGSGYKRKRRRRKFQSKTVTKWRRIASPSRKQTKPKRKRRDIFG